MNIDQASVKVKGKRLEIVDVRQLGFRGPLLVLVRDSIDRKKIWRLIDHAIQKYELTRWEKRC